MADTATDSGTETTKATFAPGEPCGVCRFPMGPGKICGNVVYASYGKGALPKFCGADGQAQWQEQHGTEGHREHQAELAGYPRRRAGMSVADAARLAEEESARLGIVRHTAAAEPETPAAAPARDAAPEAPAEPVSAVDALAELALQFGRGVGAVRQEVDAMREQAAAQAAEIAAEREQWAAEVEQEKAALEEEKQALAKDREAAKSDTERAVIEVQDANDSRLKVEGELKAARGRITELEQEIKALREQHRHELAEVRTHEEARYNRMVDAFAATIRVPEPETAAPKPRKVPTIPTPDVQEKMMQRVQNGHVTVIDREWVLSNAKANAAAANTLSWLLNECRITVTDEGQVKPTTLATVREEIEQMRQQK
jgi:hypothetical protein